MSDFPLLETERLLIREPTLDDVKPLYKIGTDEEVMLYFGSEPYPDESKAREEIDWYLKIWREKTGARWIVALKETGEVIGEIGFFDYEKKHRKAEIGYKLASSHWRKGLMSEALRAVLDYIYSETDINRTEALVDPRNPASFKLLEKHGFKIEGTLRDYEYERGAYVDLYMLSILRREWLKE